MADHEDNKLLQYFHKANHISAKWLMLGFQLGVDKDRLDCIEEENSTMDRRLLVMLDFWMKANPDHSEKKIEDALRKCYLPAKNGNLSNQGLKVTLTRIHVPETGKIHAGQCKLNCLHDESYMV